MRISSTLLTFLATATVPFIAEAQLTLVSDGFELTTHPGSSRTTAVAPGIPFYTRDNPATQVTAVIGPDAVFGSSALSVSEAAGMATSRPIIGVLPFGVTLAQINDFITLSFSFRYLNSAAATPSAANFRFGLHNSNGSLVTGDNQPTVSDDDPGYYVQVGSGGTIPAANNIFFNELVTTAVPPILAGVDRANLVSSGAGFTISDDNAHTAVFTLTRTGASAISLSLAIDGATPLMATSTSNLRTTFDEITFSNGFAATSLNFAIDNVSLVTNIPEPGTGLMLGLGMIGLAGLRRRRPAR